MISSNKIPQPFWQISHWYSSTYRRGRCSITCWNLYHIPVNSEHAWNLENRKYCTNCKLEKTNLFPAIFFSCKILWKGLLPINTLLSTNTDSEKNHHYSCICMSIRVGLWTNQSILPKYKITLPTLLTRTNSQ